MRLGVIFHLAFFGSLFSLWAFAAFMFMPSTINDDCAAILENYPDHSTEYVDAWSDHCQDTMWGAYEWLAVALTAGGALIILVAWLTLKHNGWGAAP